MSAVAASNSEMDPAAGDSTPSNTTIRIKHVYLSDSDIIGVY
ncbi:MAG: hypothetical protein AB9861_15845 [Methanosarcina sp.]